MLRKPLALLFLAVLVASGVGATTPTYSFLGCFADANARAIPNQIGSNTAMTIPMCAKLASSKGYTIFGLQVGHIIYFNLAVPHLPRVARDVHSIAREPESACSRGTVRGLQDGTQCFAAGSGALGTAMAFGAAQQYGPQVDVYGSPTPLVSGKPGSTVKADRQATNMEYCGTPCGGDKSTTCGGPWANQVRVIE